MKKMGNSVDVQNHTILIVEDNPVDLSIVVDYLESHNFQIMVSRDGEAGLRLARQDRPDLILLDVRLPGIDGFEVCRRLKVDKRTQDIPVIFMTIVTNTEDKVRGFEAGGVDYITKPFKHKEVLARVTTHLRLRELTRELEEEKESLERRVEERATALTRANQELQKEISERKRVEKALRESETRLLRAERIAHVGNVEGNFLTDEVYFSDETCRIYGIKSSENISTNAYFLNNIVHPDDREIVIEAEQEALLGKKLSIDHRIVLPDGEVRFVHENGEVSFDESGKPVHVAGTVQDITERKRAEGQLKLALADKETLLQELYHRTKNNMLVIMGLLDLQAAQSQNEPVRAILQETQNRIRSMALVHQKLYQSQNLSSIDLAEYIRELTVLLMKSYRVTPDRVSLVLELTPVPVLIDTAVPCGMIINELISNVFKHAFPHNEKGELMIILKQPAGDEIMLQIGDDGVGLPSDFDLRKSESVGLNTVFGIAEYQLQGKITCKTAKGVTWLLHFSNTLYQPRV